MRDESIEALAALTVMGMVVGFWITNAIFYIVGFLTAFKVNFVLGLLFLLLPLLGWLTGAGEVVSLGHWNLAQFIFDCYRHTFHVQ